MANSFKEIEVGALSLIKEIESKVKGLNTEISELNKSVIQLLKGGGGSQSELSGTIKKLETQIENLKVKVKDQATEEVKLIQKRIDMNNSLARQKEKSESQNFKQAQKATQAIKKNNQELDKRNKILAKSKSDREVKISKDLTKSMIAQVNSIGKTNDGLRQMNTYYSQLESSSKKATTQLSKEKAAREKLISKQMTGQMRESVNAIGQQSSEMKKLNADYKQLEKESDKAIKLADREAIARKKVIGAYNQLLSKQKEAKKVLQNLTVTQGRSNEKTKQAQKEYDKLTAKVNQANRATSNFSKTGLGSAVRGFKNLMSAFGVVGGITIFASAAREIFKVSKELDALNFSMRKIIPSNFEFQQTMLFLKDITNAYGAELVSTTTRYVKFLAAAKQSGLALDQTEKIFGTVTKAAGVLGLKTDELTGVYLALEQMLSKGKVTTEELRRQLGERLPGAFGIMANAVGVTVKELDGLLKKGEILSAEALPKFAEELERAYGIESVTKVDTLVAAQIRLQNAWIEFVSDLNASGQIKAVFDFLAENLGEILNITLKLVKGFLVYKAIIIGVGLVTKAYTFTVGALAAAKIMLAAGTLKATVAMRAFNLVTKMNPIGALVSVLALAAAAWVAFKDGVVESSQALKALEKQMFEASKAIVDNQLKILDARLDAVKKGAKSEKDANDKSLNELDRYESEVLSTTFDIYTDKAEMERVLEESRMKKQNERAEKEKNQVKKNILSAEEARRLVSSGVTLSVPTDEQKSGLFGTSPLGDAQKELLAEIERRRKKLRDIEEAEVTANAKKIKDLKEKDAFELAKRILEIQIESQEDIINNEDKFLKERLEANSEYLILKNKLIDLEAEYEIKSNKGRADKVKLIELDKQDSISKLVKEGNDNRNQIIQSDFDKQLSFFDKVAKTQERSLDKEVTDYQNSLIEKGISREDIEKKVNEKIKEIREEDLRNLIENEIEKLEAIAVTAENRIEIEERLISLRKMLSDINLPDSEKIEKATQSLNNFFQSFQNDFFSGAGFDELNNLFLTMGEDGLTQVGRLIDEIDKIPDSVSSATDKAKMKFQVYFDSIAEVAQEAFNFMNTTRDAYFDQQFSRLEQQKDIAIQFAGDSTTAREEIERQYEARRAEVQRKQAQAQKEQALFNIGINTAQAIVATLGKTGFAGIPLSIIVGAIGAAQLAMVAATPVPEFFRGTMNSPEGYAMVDEKRPEIHTDRNGKIKSTGESGANMRWLDSGDKIYTSHEEYFNKELSGVLGQNDIVPYNQMMSSIAPSISVESGLRKDDFLRGIKSLKSTIESKEGSVVNIDKNGIQTRITKNGISKNNQNNILRLKTRII